MERKYRIVKGKHHKMVAGQRITYEEGSIILLDDRLASTFGNKFQLVADNAEASAPASITPVSKLGIEDLDEPKPKPAPPPVHEPKPEPKPETPKDPESKGASAEEDVAERRKAKREKAREDEKEQKRRRARERREKRQSKE